MLADALEHLVRGIVDHPDDVRVNAVALRRGELLEVRVHPEDLGRVIGRNGRTAKALRTVVGALSPNGTVGSTSWTSTGAEPPGPAASGPHADDEGPALLWGRAFVAP